MRRVGKCIENDYERIVKLFVKRSRNGGGEGFNGKMKGFRG